jgi:hypothetical protein
MFHEVLLIPVYTKSKWDAKRKLKNWTEIGIPSLVQIELGKRCFKEYPVARLYNPNKESIHPEKTGFHILDRDKTPRKEYPKEQITQSAKYHNNKQEKTNYNRNTQSAIAYKTGNSEQKWQTKQNKEQCVYSPLSSIAQSFNLSHLLRRSLSLSLPPLSLSPPLSSVALKAASLSLAQPRRPALSLRHLSLAPLSPCEAQAFSFGNVSSRFYLYV